MEQFNHLFSNITIGNTDLKNRILSTAHQTNHVVNGIPTEELDAYQEARAKGGIGLIILEAAAVHPSGMLTTNTVASFKPDIVNAFKRLTSKVSPYGTKVFAQLFHAGREVVSSDYRNAAWAPSAVPSLRFGTMPKPMNLEEIEEVIEGFAISAQHAKEGGLDGVEICCSHGYLPAQFWSSNTNFRTDQYGGSFENRMRFIVEVIERVWERVGDDFTVGIRMSAEDRTMDGDNMKDSVQIVEYLSEKVRLDFIDVTTGNSSTYSGSTHIVPPAPMKHAYLSPQGFRIRMAGAIPVFVGSRIVDPTEAESIISKGQADMVGMTRATIVDPEMPNKALEGRSQTINACIGCLQACIGHYHQGLPIGCIQNPATGYESTVKHFYDKEVAKKSVLVIGAGPGGLQAAITADSVGHEVILADKNEKIGGMLTTMRKGPMLREMAESMIDNYSRQLDRSNVKLELENEITKDKIQQLNFDMVICATGSAPYYPNHEGMDDSRINQVDDLFHMNSFESDEKCVVFDFNGDWTGMESALYLSKKGCDVTLITARLNIGEGIPQYLRNEYMKELYEKDIKMVTHHDFGGTNGRNVIVRNLFTHESQEEYWNRVVLSVGRVPDTEFYEEIKNLAPEVIQIGDSLAPRTIEEATHEGFFSILNTESQLVSSN